LFTGDLEFFRAFGPNFGTYFQLGAESSLWWSGMGVVVIFGLFFATALTLVVVPVLYDFLALSEEKIEALREAEKEEDDESTNLQPGNAPGELGGAFRST
ncbi:MAG: efflux RND transporter permease subunit, partial [Calditrichaeota bacterium]|nr:efflux RND transporter permease subunit [Calditrichota bacterium]